MLELVAIFSVGSVDDNETMGPLFEIIDSMEGLELTRYDLNQMEHWRAWDAERATIDALTQRTQVLRAEGTGVFFFALGKHGEIPTAVVRAEAELGSIDIKQWFGIDRLMQLRMSDEGWRSEHTDLPQVWAWRDAPRGISVVTEGAARVCRLAQLSAHERSALRLEL